MKKTRRIHTINNLNDVIFFLLGLKMTERNLTYTNIIVDTVWIVFTLRRLIKRKTRNNLKI